LFYEDDSDGSALIPRAEYTLADVRTKKRKVSKHTRKVGGGRKKEISHDTANNLKIWFDMRRAENLSVTLKLIAAEARRVDPTVNELTRIALKHRLYRLLASWDVTWRRCTHKAQNTRHSSHICNDFAAYVKEKIRILNIDISNVYNADETNIPFSQERRYTYTGKGARTVNIKGTEGSNRCSVMLGANMTGDKKLLPFVIFKGVNSRGGTVRKEIENKHGYPVRLEYGVQAKAWMDEGLMIEWIEKVWKSHIATIGSLTYLLLDECSVHLTANVRQAFANCNTCIDFIPPGYTCKLQPMDIGVNKPFKDNISDAVDTWLIDNMNNKPKRTDVARWIEKAWDKITLTTIKNSFRRAGYLDLRPGELLIGIDDDEDPNYDPLHVNQVVL
jgi:hypothetical protein